MTLYSDEFDQTKVQIPSNVIMFFCHFGHALPFQTTASGYVFKAQKYSTLFTNIFFRG